MTENTLQSPPQPSANPAAATETALPAAVAEARAAITARTSDRAFAQRFAAGDATARAEMNALHVAAYPDEPAGAPAVTLDDAAKAALATEQMKQPTVREPDEIDAHLTEIGFTPGRAEEFRLPRLNEDPNAPVDMKVDGAVRGWLSEARLSPEIGNFVAAEVNKVAQRWATMSEGERTLWQQSEKLRLERLGFNSERIAVCRQMIEELEKKRPGVIQVLEDTGAGNSSTVIAMLVQHAERLAARHGGK